MIQRSTTLAFVAAVAATLLAPSFAGAQGTFSMTGRAATGSGLFVRLPAVGATTCGSLTALGTATPTMAPQTATFPMGPDNVNVVLNPQGCIPGSASSVYVNGTGGFAFPVGFFSQPAPTAPGGNRASVPNTNMVVQLNSRFSFGGPSAAPFDALNARRNAYMDASATYNTTAPGSGPETPFGAPTFAYAPWRVFAQSPHGNQTGRLGSDFTACAAPVGGIAGTPPSGAKVSCAVPSQASMPNGGGGLVKYNATAGGFGGTMGIVIQTPGAGSELYITIALPPPFSSAMYGNVPVAGMGSRAAGRGYAAYDMDVLGMAPLYKGLTTTPTSGLVGMLTSPVTTGGPSMNVVALPTQNNANWGFPWTTANVIVRATGMNAAGTAPNGGTFSLSGFDMRTAGGLGSLQLVAGHLSQSSIQGPNGTPNYSVIRLEFAPEPGAAVGLLAGVIAVAGLVGWRRRSR